MPVPVLILTPTFSLNQQLVHEMTVNTLGDGYHQTITAESTYSRANGTGTVTAYSGLNKFNIHYDKALKGSGKLADDLWIFFRARLDAINEAFYFYNPSELLVPDGTGVDTVGRYLVRLEDPNQGSSREFFRYCLFNYPGIALVEERA